MKYSINNAIRVLPQLLFYPLLSLAKFIRLRTLEKAHIKSFKPKVVGKRKVYYIVHEWLGYETVRSKKVGPKCFDCGLSVHLDFINELRSNFELDLELELEFILTYSTVDDTQVDLGDKYPEFDTCIWVSNRGMDFSGYKTAYDYIAGKDSSDFIVVFSNTSVSKIDTDFVFDAIDVISNEEKIGLLGTSINSNLPQDILYPNFDPHIQSFFLLTTNHIVSEVIHYNGGFPGYGCNNKHDLIRYGEVGFSKIILELGYSIGLLSNQGLPVIFNYRNGRKEWPFHRGDQRLIDSPNVVGYYFLKTN